MSGNARDFNNYQVLFPKEINAILK